jgi:hypothetical protein
MNNDITIYYNTIRKVILTFSGLQPHRGFNLARSTSSELPDEKFFETIMRRVRGIPFDYIIKMTTGHEVYPVKDEDAEVINEIFEKSKAVVEKARDEDFSSLDQMRSAISLRICLGRSLKGRYPRARLPISKHID